MNDKLVIVARDLTVIRGKTRALDGVSFSMEPGNITGLIGPSGSGKTTLMRAIIGVQQLTHGSLKVLGQPAGSAPLRPQLGYVSQTPSVYLDLTTKENLHYFAAMLGVPKQEVGRVLNEVDLIPQANQIVGSLSGGQLARVSLAVALLGQAPLLILDEPTVGLDPVLRERLWQLFRDLAAQGRSLLISSHVMDEAERCERLLLLREGKVLSHGTKAELLQTTATRSVEKAFLKLAGDIS
jgi:ABC-2 type transport system ATP-binding protein